MSIISAIFDWIGRAMLEWLREIRAEQALRDLGAATAANDALLRAEHDEKIALDAARSVDPHGVPDDSHNRARRG